MALKNQQHCAKDGHYVFYGSASQSGGTRTSAGHEPLAAGPQSESRNWTEDQKIGLYAVIRHRM